MPEALGLREEWKLFLASRRAAAGRRAQSALGSRTAFSEFETLIRGASEQASGDSAAARAGSPGERGGGVCGRPHPDSPGAAHAPGPPDSAAAPGDPLPAQGRPPSAPAPCPSSRTAKRGPLCTAARAFPEGGGSILANAPALSARRRGLPRPRGWVLGPLSTGISWSEEELSK